MKAKFKSVLSLVLIACTLLVSLALFGCEVNKADTYIVLRTASGDVSVGFLASDFDEGAMVDDVIKSEKFKDDFAPVGSEGEYGYFITALKGITPDASKNEFVAFYLKIAEYKDTSEYAKSITYQDVEYTSAKLGISSIPIVKGEIYIFAIGTF